MSELSYREAIRRAIDEEMERDPSVIIYGQDVELGYVFQVSLGLIDKYGKERVRDAPLSENIIVGSAVGAALGGIRPIPEIQFCDFMALAMDQLANQAAKLRYMTGGQLKIPMVLRVPVGVLANFAAQHSQSLHAWFAHVPGLRVVLPSTPHDAYGMLKTAIRDDNPVVFLEHKLLYHTKGEVPDEEYFIPFGKADVKRQGKDVTIVSNALMTMHALAAADVLEKEHGIQASIVDLRSISPLDFDTIAEEVKKTGRLVIVDEGTKSYGITGEIAARAGEELLGYLDAPIRRVAQPDTPIPFNGGLENELRVTPAHIIEAVRSICE